MLKFDFSSYNNYKCDNINLVNLKNQMMKDNKYLDWYDLNIDIDVIEQYASYIRENADIFIVIGIGGSYIGAKAVIDSLNKYKSDKTEIIFIGYDLSSDYFDYLLKKISGKSVYVNVISKSGETKETIFTFNIILDYLKANYIDYKDRIIITTVPNNNYLHLLAQREKFKLLNVSNNISGRYSVLTNIGLLPISVAGINISEIIKGAKDLKSNIDVCYKYVYLRNNMYNNNINVESFDIYDSRLYYFTEWLKQLFAESQGKNKKGIFPVSTLNPRDLHSIEQYYEDGKEKFFSTVIYNNSKADIFINNDLTLNRFNEIVMESVCSSRFKNQMNSIIIYLDTINEYNIGYLIFFFEVSACLGSYLMGVNYYDQPGVNSYKDLINKELSNNSTK